MAKPGQNDDNDKLGPPPGCWSTALYTIRRAFVHGTGANLVRMVAPAAGGPIDGVSIAFARSGSSTTEGTYATPGQVVSVEAGCAFSAGADLQTDANGRMVLHSSGTVVMRALEAAAGAGSIVWASFRN